MIPTTRAVHSPDNAPELHPPAELAAGGRVVRYATIADLSYLNHLQQTLSHSVGYTPRGALKDRIERRRIIVLEHNGQAAGYINHTHRVDQVTHISQVCVDPQIWRTRAGTLIMRTIAQASRDAGSVAITLRSAMDLECNRFWPILGFTPHGIIEGQRRYLTAWALALTDRIPVPITTPRRAGHHMQWLQTPKGTSTAQLPSYEPPTR